MPPVRFSFGQHKEKLLAGLFLLAFAVLIFSKQWFFPAALLNPDHTQQIQDIYGNSVVSRVNLGYGDSVSVETGIHYLIHCPTDGAPAGYGFHSPTDFDAAGLHIYEYTAQQSDERDKLKTGKARWNGRTFGYDVNDDLDTLRQGSVYLVSAASPFEFSCAESGLGNGGSSSSVSSMSSEAPIPCAGNPNACGGTGFACNTFTGYCELPCTAAGNVCATGEGCDTGTASATFGQCVSDCTVSGVTCPNGCNVITKHCNPTGSSSSSSSAVSIACIVTAQSGNAQLMGPTCTSFVCPSGYSPICLGPTNANCSIPCTRTSPTSSWDCRPECLPLNQVHAMCLYDANPLAAPVPGSCGGSSSSQQIISCPSTPYTTCPVQPICNSAPAGCSFINPVICPSQLSGDCVLDCGDLVLTGTTTPCPN